MAKKTAQTATKRVQVVGLVSREGGRQAVSGLTQDEGMVEFTLYDMSSRELVESSKGTRIEITQSRIAYWAAK